MRKIQGTGDAPPPVEEAVPAPGGLERVEQALVAAAVAQGLVLGGWLGFVPGAALAAGGFPPAPHFFVQFAGLLHAVLAVGYALEWVRFRRTTLLVLAKGATALFLVAAWTLDGLPWLLVVAVALESALATAAAALHGPADRARRARLRLRLVTPVPVPVRPAGQR